MHISRAVIVFSLATLILGCTTMAARGHLITAQEKLAEQDYRGAIAAAENALQLGRQAEEIDADANLVKARALEALGEPEEALELYRYIADRYPDSVYAYQARGRIKKAEASLPPP